MNKKNIIALLIITCTVIVMMAFLNSSIYKPNKNINGFNRKFIENAITKLNKIKLTDQIKGIAGITDSTIYISCLTPEKLYIANRNLTKLEFKILNISYSKSKSNFETLVYFPFAFIMYSNMPGIIKYNLITNESQINKIDTNYSHSTLVPPSSLYVKGFDKHVPDDRIIRKINLETGQIIRSNATDLIYDGGFSTSGLLDYDYKTNSIVFMNFFSNRLLCLDTNLNLIYQTKTIDTFSSYHARGRKFTLNGKSSYSYAYPPQIINLFERVHNGRLFVYSKVKADNESYKHFYDNAVIDIYDIRNGKYQGSIYVPIEDGKPLQSFNILDNLLVVAFKNSIITYKINFLLQ